jgi:hypothetical protein
MKAYYSIINGGDGSAYPHWFESQELADWDNDHQYEGWGETCTGDIEFTGEALFDITTKEGYLVELFLNEDKNLEEFKEEFFPDGIPEFEVKIIDKNYYGIYYNNELIYEHFQYPGETSEEDMNKLLNQLNK